jgi:hypothetical protein
MKEQLNEEPKIEEMPPDYEDFPDVVIDAIETFNSLGDHIYAEVGYTGKDYTNLPYYMKINKVQDEELFLDILLRLDAQAIQTSQKRIKAEVDKMKRKHG